MIVLIAILVAIAIGVGAYYIFRPKTEKDENVLAQASEVMYFEDVQVEGENAVIRAWAVGDDFTAIAYQIDNGEEVTFVKAVSGACDKNWDKYQIGFKDYRYIDTKNDTIDLTGVSVGDHILKIKVYNGEDVQTIYKVTFEVKKATATA